MSKKSKKKLAPVLAVLNLKGGVGKTTLSANLMREAFFFVPGSVHIVDLDPQFNLTQQIFKRDRYESIKSSGKTIMAVMEPPASKDIFQVTKSTEPTPQIEDVATVLGRIDDASLSILPGDFELTKYSLIEDLEQIKYVQNRFDNFIKDARSRAGLICLDCNPSSSFLTLSALRACTHILVPIRPDSYSILGLEILYDFVNRFTPTKSFPEFIVAMNGVKRSEPESSVESELRSHSRFGSMVLQNVIPWSKLLEATPTYTGFASEKPVAWRATVESELESAALELLRKMGLTNE